MSDVRPFRAVRPRDNETAELTAALPYDVYTRAEAAAAVQGKPWSFLKIDRPETFFPPEQEMYAPEVYAKAREEYEKRKADGIYLREDRDCYYLYELTMGGRSQTGFVGVTAVSDYENGICRKHENTVAAKEADRIRHVDALSAQTGPIFLAFHRNPELEQLIPQIKEAEPLYDFVTEEGIGQRVWRIDAPALVELILKCFKKVENTYIADGHHRAASAVRVSQKRRAERAAAAPSAGEASGTGEASAAGLSAAVRSSGEERVEAEYFLSVLFPENELKIMDYNRLVTDLNGLSREEFLQKIEKESAWSVRLLGSCADPEKLRPQAKYEAGMYLDGEAYLLSVKPEYREETAKDPVRSLDVSLLQETLLGPILGIGDPRTDSRIRFLGGIRGLAPLVREADALSRGESKAVSFAMYPTSMEELFRVADAGLLMPPKSTWFEPKLRSGLLIHEI